MPITALYGCAAMLLLAVLPLPYGYYTLLRLVACATFSWAAVVAHERKAGMTVWFYAVLALLFNPIIQVHFPKEIWAVLDVLAGLFLLFSSKKVAA